MKSSLTHPSAYDPTIPVGSYWQESAPSARSTFAPLSGDAHCTVAVIGGGYTGLSTALHLARDHGIGVRVLEAGAPGWAASGRNGGFCCLGSSGLGYQALIRRYGLDETRRFFDAQIDSVDLVRQLAASENIDIQASGDGELALAHKPNRFEHMKSERDFLAETFGFETTLLEPDALKERGLHGPKFHGGKLNPAGFGLHPMRYARGLADAAVQRGATVHGRSAVTAWQREGNRHRLITDSGSVTADRVVVATNGYTREDLHAGLHGRIMPVLTNIVVTRPLTGAERAAQGWTDTTMAFDSRNLLHYFRLLPDGRFLFGGRGGLDARPQSAAPMRARLERELRELFPAWRTVETTHFWRGYANLAADFVPHIGPLPDDGTVFVGLAYHGNGVAMGTWAGRALAGLAAGAARTHDLPAVVSRPLPRFPMPVLRTAYWKAAYVALGAIDRWL